MQVFSEVVPAGAGSAQPVKPFCLLGAALCRQSQQHQRVCLDTTSLELLGLMTSICAVLTNI